MLQNIKIKISIIMFAFVSLYLATAPVSLAQPKIIIDTDCCLDQDDLGAMATLNALADNGECEILAVIYDEEKANAANALEWGSGSADTLANVLTAGKSEANSITLTGATGIITSSVSFPTDIRDNAGNFGTEGQSLKKSAANAVARETVRENTLAEI